MAGHWHDPSAATQNQGNQLGTRPCVRQSQLFRQNESGNTMKSLLGSSHLQWDTKHTQGAYDGRPAYDAASDYMAQTSVAGRYHCARRRPICARVRSVSASARWRVHETSTRRASSLTFLSYRCDVSLAVARQEYSYPTGTPSPRHL